jgi:hypothetical protein
MAVAVRPSPPQLDPDPEALIEEARQRQRRRRMIVGGALGVALATGAALFLVVDRVDGSGRSRTPADAPIAAEHPSAPEPRFGSLGAVAYVRSDRPGLELRIVEGTDRILAWYQPR